MADQASLGSPTNINLGGYIPAAPQRLSIAKQALLAFLSGAAGAAGNKVVEGALTPDVSDAATKDATLAEAGMTPAKKNMVQRFLTPTSQADLERMQQVAGQKNYQTKSLGLEGERVTTEKGRAATEAQRAKDTMDYENRALKQSGSQFQQGQLAESLRNNQKNMLDQQNFARESKMTNAQAALLKSEQDKNNLLTTQMKAQRLNDLIGASTDPKAPATQLLFRQAAGDAMNAGEIDPTTQTMDQMSGPVQKRYQALIKASPVTQGDYSGQRQGFFGGTVIPDATDEQVNAALQAKVDQAGGMNQAIMNLIHPQQGQPVQQPGFQFPDDTQQPIILNRPVQQRTY